MQEPRWPRLGVIVGVTAVALSQTAGAATRPWKPPSLQTRCEVVQAFLGAAVRRKLFPKAWVLVTYPNPEDPLVWGRGGPWRGSAPPVASALLDAPATSRSNPQADCPGLASVVAGLGGASGQEAEAELDRKLSTSQAYGQAEVGVSLPMLSADASEGLLSYFTTCGILCGGDFLAYLRRDKAHRWRLVGLHVTGD